MKEKKNIYLITLLFIFMVCLIPLLNNVSNGDIIVVPNPTPTPTPTPTHTHSYHVSGQVYDPIQDKMVNQYTCYANDSTYDDRYTTNSSEITTTGRTATSITVNWSKATAFIVQRRAFIDRYNTYDLSNSAKSLGGYWSNDSTTSLVDTGLTPNTRYVYRLFKDYAFDYYFWCTDTTLAAIPTSLSAVRGSDRLTISWNANGNPSDTNYELVNTTTGKTIYTGTSTSYTETGLKASTTYSYKVRAKSRKDIYTSYTGTVSFSTTAPVPPSISTDKSGWVKGSVRVTIGYDTAAVTKRYRVQTAGSNGTSLDYTGAFDVYSTCTVFASSADANGNWSAAVSRNITIDNTSPTGQLIINDNTPLANYKDVQLKIDAQDTESGLSKMMVSEDKNFTGVAWVPFSSTYPWTLSGGIGSKTIYLKLMDAAGNISSPISSNILYVELPAFLKSVYHNQVLNVNGKEVIVKSPTEIAEGYTLPSGISSIYGQNLFTTNKELEYRIEFNVDDSNKDLINDLLLKLRLNDTNEDGINFKLKSITLNKLNSDKSLSLIKDLMPNTSSPNALGYNQYSVTLGKVNGKSVFAEYGSGDYCIDYKVVSYVKYNELDPSILATTVTNDAVIQLMIGSDVPNFTEIGFVNHRTTVKSECERLATLY